MRTYALIVVMSLFVALVGSPPTAAADDLLLINEVMSAPSSGGEWLELLNLGPTAIDLSGWRIDDDMLTNTTRYTLPAGTTIAPGALLVVGWNSAILNNGGDLAQLVNSMDQIVATVIVPAAVADHAYARIPDGSANWNWVTASPGDWNAAPPELTATAAFPPPTDTAIAATPAMQTVTASASPSASETQVTPPLASATPTHTPTPAPSNTATPTFSPTPVFTAGVLLISEIAPADDPEWIEVVNRGSLAIDLTGWRLVRENGAQPTVRDLPAVAVAPGEYLVIALSARTLPNDGAALSLYGPGNALSDGPITYPALAAGQSYARLLESSEYWLESDQSSPGYANPPLPSPTATASATVTASPTATRTPSPTRHTECDAGADGDAHTKCDTGADGDAHAVAGTADR
ncbi:MAG: hypothetical protein HC822_23495 [Oscillochloris sp.]|nr:hypothetical protein [Oscillochloris sp.]